MLAPPASALLSAVAFRWAARVQVLGAPLKSLKSMARKHLHERRSQPERVRQEAVAGNQLLSQDFQLPGGSARGRLQFVA